jgi:hypothetical protein
LGKPTSSNFDKIITPARGEPSRSAPGYRHELLAEWLTGQPSEGHQNGWMERGSELEAEARAWYAWTHEEVEEVGFVWLDDEKMVGCSPDGLIGVDGGMEIKVPAPKTHVSYLLANKLPTDYIPQVQGSLWITGRQWWDFVSYCPGIDPLVIRVQRDEPYIGKLAKLVGAFVETMKAEQEELIKRGLKPKEVRHAA